MYTVRIETQMRWYKGFVLYIGAGAAGRHVLPQYRVII